MSEIATCAKCGKIEELCQSVREDGIKQPRFCKACVIDVVRTGNDKCNPCYWAKQIQELGDTETLKAFEKTS